VPGFGACLIWIYFLIENVDFTELATVIIDVNYLEKIIT
jgi:hypothetical protein